MTVPVRRAVAALALLALVAAGCGGDDDDAAEPVPMEESDRTPVPEADIPDGPAIDGLETFGDLSAGHERGDLDYDLSPPVGGDHNPFWQACGLYEVPVPEERAVHALEHGAVWIAHQPGVDVSSLADTVAAESHLLVSPIEGLASPLVASAWGAQVALDGVDDPRLQQFIDAYIRQGPEAAPCIGGGVGVPPTDIGPGLDV